MGWLDNIAKKITASIRQLVAFLFFVFTAGMLFGMFVSRAAPIFLFIPPLMGLVAFYNEKIALLMFAALIIFVI